MGDGSGNARSRGRYGLEEGDSGGTGPVAVAAAGWSGWSIAGVVVYGCNSRRGEIRHTIPRLRAGGFCIKRGVCFDCAKIASGDSRGAACGGIICLLVTFWTGVWTKSVMRSGLTPLVLLFLVTFFATRAGKQRKTSAGLAEARHGRSAAQVIANLSVAGICVSPWSAWIVSGETSLLTGWAILGMKIGCLAALVEAAADTVSSEIGQAFGGDPVLLTGLRRVRPGTDGAVTLLGSCAGVAAGALVAIAGGWSMHLKAGATALGAGVCGLFFDSFLGATAERRGWMGNDLVNFASTLFAAALAAVVYRFFLL